MKLGRAYTARQLNRGEGMVFHPLSGEPLSELQYCTWGSCWRKNNRLPQMGWQEIQYQSERLPCINGSKKHYVVGEVYPSHWKFDPWTGEPFKKGTV
jgi:hypothetical protein